MLDGFSVSVSRVRSDRVTDGDEDTTGLKLVQYGLQKATTESGSTAGLVERYRTENERPGAQRV